MTVPNKNYIQEDIKSRLNLGNACYQSVQNILSVFYQTNIKIKIYETIILCCFIWVWNLVSHH